MAQTFCSSKRVLPIKEELMKLYWDDGLSFGDLGKRFAMSKTSLRRLFTHLEIARRSQSEAVHLAYLQGKLRSPAWKGGFKTSRGYIRVLKPDHPHCDSQGYVLQHRLVMEEKLGRYLLSTEKVHHKGTKYEMGSREDKSDNREENLELLSPTDHSIRTIICSQCGLRKEIRLLRWQIKELQNTLQARMEV